MIVNDRAELDLQPAADVLFAAAQSGQLDLNRLTVLDQLVEHSNTDPLAMGLAVQLAVLSRWTDAGESLGGWKVGLTSRGGRDSMGADFRPFGYVLAGRILASGDRVALADIGTCSIEPELGLTMACDLGGPAVTLEQAEAAVGSVHPAFEILSRRVPSEARRPLVRLADGLGQWGIVFGDAFPAGTDLATLRVELSIDGELRDAGPTGPEVVDDPYLSVVRVCKQLDKFGLGLRAGQRLITGSILEPIAVGIGEVDAAFLATDGSPLSSVRVELS